MYCQLDQAGCAAERFGGVGKKMSGHDTEIQSLNERQEILKSVIEGKLKVQSRANERLHEIIEESRKWNTKRQKKLYK